MAFGGISVLFQSKNLKTGIADYKGNIYVNGSTTPTFSNVAATEIGNGDYYIALSSAQVTSAGAGDYVFVIDSATYPSQSIAFRRVDSASLTSLDAHLSSQDTAISNLQGTSNSNSSNITAIKTDLETGTNSLAAINAAIAAVQSQVSSLQNNSSFSVYGLDGGLVIPVSGTQLYQIPVNFTNSDGSAIDPDNGTCTVDLVNLSGQDFGSYLTGYTAGQNGQPGTAPLVKKALGKWYINLNIPSNATPAQYNADFSYSLNGKPENKTVTISLQSNVQAGGFSLESTSQSIKTTLGQVQTTTSDSNTRIQDVQSQVENGTYGLSALQSNQQTIITQTNKLGDSTIGLAALQSNQSSILGAGFTAGQDDLHSIRQLLNTFGYTGGKAV